MWRAFLDRLPTKTALIRWNIHVESNLCVWCEDKEETTDHILTGCNFSAGVWHSISTWFRIPKVFVFSIVDLVVLHKLCAASGHRKMLLQGIFVIASWRIWRARNEKVFRARIRVWSTLLRTLRRRVSCGINIDLNMKL
ncbi:putative reverse transcriptase zinc-binding domain-containing protein [Helianthus annuus]|uniref:Reverse transcriptase zinc-binding domain-containing protein n=1 Tax=Helianthus annuus TaxID=4232 RepID=A0A9K3JDV4_HELAN|nr:putative reverse transcriptase zinc-binding domain-containing protein [Helianthus annuus]KAJ0941836.1 putative reverse transcriptase zinc-binding domain-containing protein [Helianthus annuus]